MSRMSLIRSAALASRPSWQPDLLIGANMLAAIGGGRVLSAGTGITGLAVLGSGSILALLTGNALGLGLQIALRRFSSSRALAWLSISTVLSSLSLLAIVWIAASPLANAGSATVWNGGRSTLSQPAAWLFFLGLIARCALWFTGRSLRSGLAASLRSSWLAFTEAAYFLGFIIGLLIGPVFLPDIGSVVSALLLDILLLSLVAAGDFFRWRLFDAALQLPIQQKPRELVPLTQPSFWRLTAAFSAATVACQVVVFHCADVLAQTRRSIIPAWSDLTIASFYLGVALAATCCAHARPALQRGTYRTPHIVLWPAARTVRIPLLLLIALVSVLTLTGMAGLTTTAARGTPWNALVLLSLAAIGVGAGLFEIVVLSVLGRIRSGGSGAVALAFGVAATTAAVALFLMLLGNLHFPGWALTIVVGFTLTIYLLWRAQGQSLAPNQQANNPL